MRAIYRKLCNKIHIKFSIIVPTYNRSFCIADTINSALAQTYKNFEIIIVDDGSTDDTESLIKQKYSKELSKKKIIYHKLPSNCGVCRARNTGLKLANNDWIVYLDDDNIMYENFLKAYRDAIIRHRGSKLFYAQICKQSDGGLIGREFNFKELCEKNYIDIGVFVHHKSMVAKYGDFDENLRKLEDWDLIVRYTRCEAPVYLPFPLLSYSDSLKYKRITTSESCSVAKEYVVAKMAQYDKTK